MQQHLRLRYRLSRRSTVILRKWLQLIWFYNHLDVLQPVIFFEEAFVDLWALIIMMRDVCSRVWILTNPLIFNFCFHPPVDFFLELSFVKLIFHLLVESGLLSDTILVPIINWCQRSNIDLLPHLTVVFLYPNLWCEFEVRLVFGLIFIVCIHFAIKSLAFGLLLS